MLSKEASSTIFWVFGMTRPEIDPRFPRPLANTIYIFVLNPLLQAEFDTSSVFKRSSSGLNSVFFFSQTSFHTKDKEPSRIQLISVQKFFSPRLVVISSQHYYLCIVRKKREIFKLFWRALAQKWNANCFVWNLNPADHVHFLR